MKSRFVATGLSRMKIILPAILVFLVFAGAGFYVFYLGEQEFVPVQAGAGQNVQGWIWSENIGWISLNSSNCDPDNDGQSNGAPGCPSTGTSVPNYGVSIYRPSNWSDAEAGKFSGWAWSENIGWITFDRATAGNPPAAPFLNATNTILAALDDDSNSVRGWTRAVSACKNNYWNGSACTSTLAGNAAGGWDGWIKLGPSTMGVDATPPIISDVTAINITSNSATVTWSTDEISTSQVEYGLTVSYGSQTTLDSTLTTSHSVNLTGLSSNTLYHYRVKSKDAANNEAVSGDYTFTTLEAPGSLSWTQTNNPVNNANTERAQAIAVDSSGIYITGSDKSAGAGRWRVEKRSIGTGDLITSFGSNGIVTSDPHVSCVDTPYAIAVDSTGIYVAGQANAAGACGYYRWRVEKRSLTTGALITSFGTNGIVDGVASGSDARRATAIAVDSTGIYVAGYDAVPGNYQWRVEKLNPTNGSSIWVQISNPSSQTAEYAYAITVDSTGFYVAGSDLSLGSSNAQWRVEKRNLTDGNLITSFGTNGVATSNPSSSSDVPYTITVDSTGFYVAGYDSSPGNYQWRVEKRGLTDGSQIWAQTYNPSTSTDQAQAITVDSTGIYVAGSDGTVGSSNLQWRVEKRSLITGVLIYAVTSNPSSANDEALAITVDSSAIYAVGYDNVPGNEQWRIEKRAKGALDASAPIISSVAATNITYDSATVVWNTDETANSQVDYGLTTSYGTTLSYTLTYGTFHVTMLTGLSQNTTYNFRVKSKDADNNEAISGNYTFTTSATTLGTIGDQLGTGGVYSWSEGSIYGVSMPSGTNACKKGTVYAGTTGDPYPSVTNINAGRAHSLAIKTTGKVEAWGSNWWGQLGTGAGGAAYTSKSTLMSNTIALAAGYDNSLAVKSDGTVWAWGANGTGQLGIGTMDNTSHTTPVQVLGPGGAGYLTGVTAVALSYFSSAPSYSYATSFALKSDGTVWTWGYGYSTTPVQLSQGVLSDIVAISAKKSGLMLALKSDGTVWTWGTYPVQVQDSSGTGYLNNVVAISASGNHSLALKSDGTVWAWGTNSSGQLGDGTTTNRTLPVQVSGLSSVKAISAAGVGYFHSLALKSDGTVWAWGQNNYGQLGNGTTDSSAHSTPAQVPGLSGISAISAGDANSFALESSGNVVWAWGFNNSGEANYNGGPLGDGTTTNRSSPVQVQGIYSGVSWTNIPCPTGGTTYALWKTTAPQTGLIAWVWDSGVKLYRTTNDGQTWTLVQTGGTSGSTSYYNQIFVQAGNQIYAYCGKSGGGYVQICRSSDDGQTWTQSVTPVYGTFCSLYSSFLGSYLVLVGTCFVDGGAPGQVTISGDLGQNWVQVFNFPGGNITGLEYVESGAGAVISPTFGFIAFNASGGGQIWKRVTIYTYPQCTSTSSGENRLSNGAAGCPPSGTQLCGVVYATSPGCNYMQGFANIGAVFPFTPSLYSMSVLYGNDFSAPSPTDILYAVVKESVSPYIAKVIKSTDFGSTWTTHLDTGLNSQPGRIAKLLNEAKLLFTLYNNNIYKISP